MSFHRLRAIGLLALAVSLLAGCGKDSPTSSDPTTQQDADDAAQQVGFMMAAGGGASPGYPALTSGGSAEAFRSGRSGPSPVVESDTTFVSGHVTWTLSRTWFDAGNNVQTDYNPITTVRVALASRGVGSIETASDTASFGGAGSLDIRGISYLQDTLTTNAARNDTLQCSFTPRFRDGRIHTYVVSTGAWSNVIQLKPVESHPWPISGTAVWTLSIDRLATGDRGSVTRHFEATVVVTFNGTGSASVLVTGGFRYTLNLQSGVVARVG